jgi:hypothetical protein
MREGHNHLKIIWFEGEMLPDWAQILDVGARLCPASDETRKWFCRFTNAAGGDDARTILDQAKHLCAALRENKHSVITELQRTRSDGQAHQIFAAWEYALETMMQVAASKKTCSWRIADVEQSGEADFGDGDITLRRV